MRRSIWLAVPALCGLLVLSAPARGETKVELKGVHLCCGACIKGVGAALKGIEGVKPACDKNAGTVTITATDDATAQKAVDALSDAGFFGTSSNDKVAIKPATGVAKGKVKSLSLSSLHNCCGSCCKAIKGAVKTVDGVKGDTAKPKVADFEVTGDFDPADVLKALNAAGFQAQVKP
jgi:mercuric ion binding protein